MAQIKYLTNDERSKIQKLRKNGMTIHSIAMELHRSTTTISVFLRDPKKYVKSIKIGQNPYEKLQEKIKKNKKNDKRTNGQDFQRFNYMKTANKNEGKSKDIRSFNGVVLEHRAVIKYLLKKSYKAKGIYEELKTVYESNIPNYTAVQYWVKKFQKDKQTLLNDTTQMPPSSSATTPSRTGATANKKPKTSSPLQKNIKKKLTPKKVIAKKPKSTTTASPKKPATKSPRKQENNVKNLNSVKKPVKRLNDKKKKLFQIKFNIKKHH